MKEYQLVVLLDPVEGQDEEFNAWYDGKHLPDLLAIDGIVNATRYRRAELPPTPGRRAYMAVYDIRTDDLTKVMAEMNARVQSGVIDFSPTIDSESMILNVYEKIKKA
jgi:hypothetical protein